MIAQLSYYQQKLQRDGQIDPSRLLLLAQDDQLLGAGADTLRHLGAEIQAQLGCTGLIIGKPILSYVDLLLAGAAPGAERVIPLDTETRTFLHDLPLVGRDAVLRRGAVAIAEKLQRRKGVIVEGLGLVAVGALTIEQAYVNFCSLLHALVVKVLLDLLREPLPAPVLLRGLAPLWQELGTAISRDTRGMGRFNSDNQSDLLAAMDTAGRRTVALGLVDSFFGNISAAHQESLYISQTGASLDRLCGCIDLVRNDDSSCVGLTASSELAAHRALYAASKARTILHGHPRFSVILSLLCEEACNSADCWKDCDKVRDLNGVPLVAGEVGAGGLARNLPPVIGRCGLALVYGHGVFAIGTDDFSEPLVAMIDFENWCRRQYLQRLNLRFVGKDNHYER
jgi:ribulose-5-phosphate 4-epimerase/fuculose-1-phosphate aldolase